MTDLDHQIKILESEIITHRNEVERHSFNLKAKEAKLRKLHKQVDRIKEILNEQLPSAVS